MKTMGVAAIAAALLITTGCSGADESGESVASGQDVADMIGCTGWSDTSEEIYVAEGGTCQLDGDDVGVYYFADNDARDSYVDAGSDFGGNYLIGDGWVVDGPPAVLEGLQADHGGDLSAG